jgi:hypothetical protein
VLHREQQEVGEFVSHHSDWRASARIGASLAELFRLTRNVLLAFLVLGCGSALAQNVMGGDTKFDHATTGFFLNNQHVTARCESCHIQGVFRGTPRDCNTCHRNASRPNATQFPLKHIPTIQQCDVCHKSVDWNIVMFTHQGVVRGTCQTCHNGALATGKPVKHITTTASCDVCHNTLTWIGTTFNHVGVPPGTCENCHNGRDATGKRPTHIPTTASCDTCHTTATWVTTFNHSAYTPPVNIGDHSCATCHNRVTAPGQSRTHIPTTTACDTCHRNFVSFVPAAMDHTGMGGRCSTCHSGGYLSENAQTKPTTHVSTTAQCDSSGCHASTSTWATNTFNHGLASPPVVVGDHTCATCHKAGGPGLSKPGTHIPTTVVCDACHTNFTAFKPAIMSHDGTSGQCSTCHNGSYTGVGTYGAQAKPSVTHVTTNAQCDTCHSTIAWKPATYTHDNLAPGRCSNCHNNVVAQGFGGNHIPDGRQCDTCHSGYVSFLPANMNHTGLGGRCSTCHNGSYLSENAQAKSGTHQVTTAQCDTCHTSTITWATAVFDHALNSPPVVIGDHTCATCHVAGHVPAGLPMPSTHIPTAAACDTCHSNFSAFRPAIMNHTGTATQCSNCHNGSYTSVGTFGAQAKSSTHITTASQCDVCHSTTAWKPANYNHNGVTLGDHSCGTCHNGTIATGKGASHIPETRACDICHTSMSNFLLATMNHTGLAGQCSTCHGGGYLSENAQTKSTSHVSTNAQCDSSGCHASTSTWATRTVNHALLSPAVNIGDHSCGKAGCHVSGGTGLPKPTNHIPTTQACDVCHKNFTAFNPAAMDHTGTTGACNTCHNGSYTAVNAQAKPATGHIPTTASCDVCHRTTAWMPLITPYGHSGVAAGTCSTCHIASYANISVKPANHIPTNAACDACHTLVAWTPLKTPYSHTGITAGSCTTCHVSSYALMDYKQANHIPTSASCDVCHRMTAWLPLITPYSHSGIAAGTCTTCHVSTYAQMEYKLATHIPTTASCEVCHRVTAWIPLITPYSHSGLASGSCLNCHVSSFTNIDYKPVVHIPTPRAAYCDDCHRMTASTWLPVIKPYSHTAVVAGSCSTCHIAPYTGITLIDSNHIPTSSVTSAWASCDACHNTTTFANYRLHNVAANNTAVAGKCTQCHEYGNPYGLQGRTPSKHTSTARKAPNSCDNSGCHSVRGF